MKEFVGDIFLNNTLHSILVIECSNISVCHNVYASCLCKNIRKVLAIYLTHLVTNISLISVIFSKINK